MTKNTQGILPDCQGFWGVLTNICASRMCASNGALLPKGGCAMKPLVARHPGSRLCVITSHPGFERVAGMRAQKKTRLYNGRLECNFMRF